MDFSKYEDVHGWLKEKPRAVAIVIAARAALRAVPVLGSALGPLGAARRAVRDTNSRFLRILPVFGRETKLRDGNVGSNIVLPVLRATASSWVVAAYPGRGARVQDAAIAAVAVSSPARRAASGNATAYAAASASAHAAAVAAAPLAASAAASADAAYAAVCAAEALGSAAAYTAIGHDAAAIERGLAAASLAGRPLWRDGQPRLVSENWQWLVRALHALDENWEVWTAWYEAQLEGRPKSKDLEVARVLIEEAMWRQGPKVVNAEIRRLIEQHENPEAPLPPAVIPAQKPAAVETIWDKGKLSVPKTPAKSNLSKKKLEAAFGALRTEFLELANDVNVEGNIDKRPAAFLRRLATQIPEKMPRQHELFRLGHAEAIFADYAKTVTKEWPEFLAARYHAVSLQFDRTMRQSPMWREFVQNAAKQTMDTTQIADSILLAGEAAKALQQQGAPEFVDPVVPRTLQQLAEALPVPPTGGESDAVEAGKELLAVDLVESVNNVFKPIAEIALSYAGGFGEGLEKAAKNQGPIDGEKAFKWLRRLAIGGVGTGSFVALSNLIARFPEAFAWLERVLHVLK